MVALLSSSWPDPTQEQDQAAQEAPRGADTAPPSRWSTSRSVTAAAG